MANMEDDPGASTQQFRAYVDGGRSPAAPDAGKRSPVPIVIAVVVAVVLVAAVAFFVLR